jgi:catechol 2,3-dioxygenase-like lactoylglutathione lyase family enzyme
MEALRSIPALPVRDMKRSVEFYRDELGFTLGHREDGFAIFRRDAAEIHLWVANDECWRTRGGTEPVVSGAESFIAGTASCRIEVSGVDELYTAYRPLGVLHCKGEIVDQWWGSREFHVTDPDNNLLTFFERK